VYEPGPVILTTRTHWKQDPSGEINTLMAVRERNVLQVCFHPSSPQFSATVALDALADPDSASGFLTTLRELAAGLPVSRPAVSQHLRVLKEARLVRDRRAGTRRIYELNPEGIAMLRDHFAKLWDQSLLAFKKFAEDEYEKEKKHDPRSQTGSRPQTNHARKRPH
jgi:DNA-binding transcriptional ArsR family regulator